MLEWWSRRISRKRNMIMAFMHRARASCSCCKASEKFGAVRHAELDVAVDQCCRRMPLGSNLQGSPPCESPVKPYPVRSLNASSRQLLKQLPRPSRRAPNTANSARGQVCVDFLGALLCLGYHHTCFISSTVTRRESTVRTFPAVVSLIRLQALWMIEPR